MPPMKAAFKAMEEISFAVIAITVSLVAVFTPLAFQKSQTGRLFIEFAAAVVGSVIISAFVALTLSPAMAARLLKPLEGVKHGALFNFFERMFAGLAHGYARSLRWALAHRVLMLLVTLGTFALMVVTYKKLDQDFLPNEDKSRLFCMVLTPNGSTSEFTDRQLRKGEAIISKLPEVTSYGGMVAPGFGGPGQANMSVLFVTLKDRTQRDLPGIVHAEDDAIGEIGVEPHARRESKGIVGVERHDQRAERRGDAGGDEDGAAIHSCFG